MALARSFVSLAIASFVIACAAVSGATAQVAAAPPAFKPAEYRLGAGDKLRLNVFGEAPLSGEFVVGASGRLALPLIGEIDAQGATVTDVEHRIDAKLRGAYLLDPKVSVEIINYRPYYILGEVRKPGEYPYSSDLTVVKAVATAEGYTYRANTKRVFIKRLGEAAERPYPASSATLLAPGDTIRVAERLF